VGKTTCAAAFSLRLARAPRRRVLLLSADPAHSLADVLDRPLGARPRPVAPGLEACEIDAAAALESWRARYREAVSGLFSRLTRQGMAATYDQRVMEDLVELAPPGIDEILAVLQVARVLGAEEAKGGYETVVIDAAPTGHALRMLAMPELALSWIQAMLAVLLKYREVTGLGALAEELVATSRALRGLGARLRDPRQAAIVVVTRAAELPRLETARLLSRLRRQRVAVSAVVVNALTPSGCRRCRRAAAAERREVGALATLAGAPRMLVATPAVAPPPRGGPSLSRWSRTWKRIERTRTT
jgi:arsenite-transporting ATPase